MAKQIINRGSNANDGTGDSLRDGADKLNTKYGYSNVNSEAVDFKKDPKQVGDGDVELPIGRQ